MKKILFAAFALFLLSAGVTTAQTSAARAAHLAGLQTPKSTDLPKVDKLVKASQGIAGEAILISPLLERVKEKVTGNEDSSELAGEVAELSKRITKQSENLGDISGQVSDAAAEIKSVKNPMKVKAATTALNYSKDVIATVTEETTYQVSTIAELVQKLAQ